MRSETMYLLDEEQFARLGQIWGALCKGSDREQDYGQRLWAVLSEVREYGEVPAQDQKNNWKG